MDIANEPESPMQWQDAVEAAKRDVVAVADQEQAPRRALLGLDERPIESESSGGDYIPH